MELVDIFDDNYKHIGVENRYVTDTLWSLEDVVGMSDNY